ncbi:MAG TPA: hypothetical protein VGG54_23075 [Trebonia sp.]|jgi:hypothetical protein
MTTPSAALRVTALEAIALGVAAEYEAARKDAEAEFHTMVSETGVTSSRGALQVPVELGGQVIAHLSIKAGAKNTEIDETGLHEWVAERNPDALEPVAIPGAEHDERLIDLLLEKRPDLIRVHVAPGALNDPGALALIAAELPDLMSSRVRPSALTAYLKEAQQVAEHAPKGWLFDPDTGERLQLVTETQNKPTGAFAFIGAESEQRRAAVMAALQADPELRASVLGGALALTAGEPKESTQ